MDSREKPGNLYEAVIALEGVKADLRRLQAGELPRTAPKLRIDKAAIMAKLQPILEELTGGHEP